MVKLKVKVVGIELEYEGDEKLLETEIPRLLEAITKSHNDKLKWNLLLGFEDIEKNLLAMDNCASSIASLNEELAIRIEEFFEKLNHLLENMRAGSGSQEALLDATKTMQETQMSFNLQYLQLQSQMQHENRSYTAISNIMKTKHDTVKNSISNVR